MVREPGDESSVNYKELHLLLFEGVSQSTTPEIFTGSIFTLLCEIITLRYSILKFTFLWLEVELVLTHAV
jgi:hypothetical protein